MRGLPIPPPPLLPCAVSCARPRRAVARLVEWLVHSLWFRIHVHEGRLFTSRWLFGSSAFFVQPLHNDLLCRTPSLVRGPLTSTPVRTGADTLSPTALDGSTRDMSTDYLQEPELPRRRVSITTDPVFETRKLSYVPGDADRTRRISVATDWAMDGNRKPSQQLTLSVDLLQNDGRRRSILRNPHDNISLYSNHPDADNSRKSTLTGKTPDTLSLYSHYSNYPQENGKLGVNGDLSPSKKNSTVDSISEKIRYLEKESPKPWWFLMCKKCHQDDSTYPSWEPPLYRRLCPSPFCPSYRRLARVLSLCLLCLLSWGIVYVILGSTAAPGGQVFNLALLCICAHVGGWLMTLVNLPALVGMLLVGILFENVGLINVEDDYEEFVVILRHISLVIILTRAGLDLDPQALRKLYATVLKLALVPWLVECVVMAMVAHFLMDLPWLWGFLLEAGRVRRYGRGGSLPHGPALALGVPTWGNLLCVHSYQECCTVPSGVLSSTIRRVYLLPRSLKEYFFAIHFHQKCFQCHQEKLFAAQVCQNSYLTSEVLSSTIRRVCLLPRVIRDCLFDVKGHQDAIIAAVSPAVVVPCLFKLREKGYGVSKGIPTLVIAISAIDDGTSVAVFGVIKSFLFSSGESTTFQIVQGPLSIFGGIAFGVIWGYMSKYIPERHDPFAVPLRILMLLGGGVLAVLGSEKIGLAGAGPLGCIAAAFMCLHHWTQQGWEIEDNPVATAFEIFWMIFEPILFGLTGTQIKIWELDSRTVYICLACLISGILIRLVATMVVGIGCRLNLKEKIFVALTCMSKAGVQAALGPVALSSLSDDASDEEKTYGQMILTTCVLSILLTAPTGAILISMTGSKLLKKVSSAPPSVAGWRSRRPSIRDITIINEEEDSGENFEAT
uniref:(California timema) hypothetical protein n=1 Tax=Timema californicum TaxID=61474 RepID=A0A7R9J559_TIMCA|nr:unnamed protein product [Timema californicum]